MNILHLSDTTLSGAIIRIVDLTNKYSPHQARHIVHDVTTYFRQFKTDMAAPALTDVEILKWFEWADIIHYHNRWKRQKIFERKLLPPSKPSVIQIHSPRDSEIFKDEAASGIPIAVVAQYHVRQWPEAKYVVPNVVDINDSIYLSKETIMKDSRPVVSFAPSNWNCTGWNDKGYGVVAPILKRLKLSGAINYQLIVKKSHHDTMMLKREADIGIDDIVTGSYHLSSLEYLAMGVCCFCMLDPATEAVVRGLTGCQEKLPWLPATKYTFRTNLINLIRTKKWVGEGQYSRSWMEKYWNPDFLLSCYMKMYEDVKKNYHGGPSDEQTSTSRTERQR